MMTGPAAEFLEAIKVLRHAAVGNPTVRVEDVTEGPFWWPKTVFRLRYLDGSVTSSYQSLNALFEAYPESYRPTSKHGQQILERAQGHLEDRLRCYLTGEHRSEGQAAPL